MGGVAQMRWSGLWSVPDIDPVDGWILMSGEETDGQGFTIESFVARSESRDVLLDTSRTAFEPTSARFAWLVRHRFPKRPHARQSWSDELIDAAIVLDAQQVAA